MNGVLLAVLICALCAAAYWRVKIKQDLVWPEVYAILLACVLMPGHMLKVVLRRKEKR